MDMKIIIIKPAFKFDLSILLLAPLMFISSLSVDANQKPDIPENDLFFDMPIVLSANRLKQPVSAAAVSISVIDRETIIASGARTIPEVLRLVPGMQIGYSGNMFGDEPRYTVTYHGHSDQYSKQMQVLIDGRSIYEPFFGGINWKAIPVNINDIERIEISRGPNLATYGSNSFQAAINIITRTAAEDQGSFIQTNIGANNIRDLTYRYGGSNGNLDYRITASTLNDDGLDSANEFDYPDDTQSNNIDYRLDYQIDNNNTLSYQGGYGRNHQQTDRNHNLESDTGLPSPYPLARTVQNTHFFQFLKWENVINQENTLLLQYYYNLSDKNDGSLSDPIIFPIPVPLPPPLPSTFDPITLDLNGDIKSQRHNLELTHFITPYESLKFVWGLSAQLDIVKAPLYFGRDDAITHNQFRTFGNVEWYINPSNIINLGALVEKNDFTDTELSPRLSFTHIFNKQHSIRIGISQAIRSPFTFEAEADTSITLPLRINGQVPPDPLPDAINEQVWLGSIPGKIDLQNEKIISREIAYYGNFLNSALLFNARFFHDKLNNYIDLEDDPSNSGAQAFQNILDSTTTGLELELDYHIDTSLRLVSSAAVINIASSNTDITSSAPQHSFSFITIKQFNEKYGGSIAYYYVDAFKFTDSSGSGTNEYSTMDMRLSRNLKFGHSHGSLSVVLKNLLGDYTAYQEQPDYGAPKVIHSQLAYIDFSLNF